MAGPLDRQYGAGSFFRLVHSLGRPGGGREKRFRVTNLVSPSREVVFDVTLSPQSGGAANLLTNDGRELGSFVRTFRSGGWMPMATRRRPPMVSVSASARTIGPHLHLVPGGSDHPGRAVPSRSKFQ